MPAPLTDCNNLYVAAPFQLLHFTDPHLFADRTGVMRGVCTFDTLSHALARAQQRHWPADAIIVTGDIAQDESREAYQVFKDTFSTLGVPVYCLPGNHDNVIYMQEVLNDPPFQYCGHIDTGAWLIPLLSSHRPGKASGHLAAVELTRLATLLRNNPDKNVLVALHHHPVLSGSRWLDTVTLRNPDELFTAISGHKSVRGLLWGHIHQVFDQRHEQLALLATPSTCSQFLAHSDTFALDEKHPPAYRWLKLYDDGTLATAIEWCD